MSTQIVRQDNEGNEFWLYDESFGRKLRESGVVNSECCLRNSMKQAEVVVCELYQDDPLHILVHIGAKPSKKELAFARWQDVQAFQLNIPSGRLRIEGATALSLGEEEPDVLVSEIECPPGAYSAFLWNIDWDATKDDLGELGDKPYQVLALVPKGTVAKNSLSEPVPWTAPVKKKPWEGKYRMVGSEFHGLYRAPDYWDTLMVNLPRDSQSAGFPLAGGELLEFECELGKLAALYMGVQVSGQTGLHRQNLDRVQAALPDASESAYARHEAHQDSYLQFGRVHTDELLFEKRSKWLPCILRKL